MFLNQVQDRRARSDEDDIEVVEMNFLFACGGTAGHINPAIAIATELRNRLGDAKILFVGASRELEKTLIPRAGFHVVNIKMSGLKRGLTPKKILHNVSTAKSLFMADFAAANLLKRFKPDVVIGTGGYICYPVLKKAARMKIPTVVHESNAVPGLTTKLLSRFVDKVLVSFPNQTKAYKRPERVIFTGTPIREGFKTALENQPKESIKDKPLVLSFWGSLGAENMNDIISDVIKRNVKNKDFTHIHVAGSSSGVENIKKKLMQEGIGDIEKLQPLILIKDYIDDMPSKMVQANLVICRGGGSTVAELIELNKPAIIVPSPYVANDEQNINTMELIKIDGAIQLDEKSLSGEKLYDVIATLLSNKDELSRMSANLKSIAAPNATAQIVDIIESMIKA